MSRMPPRHRVRRVSKWISLAVCVALLAAAVVAQWWHIGYVRQSVMAVLLPNDIFIAWIGDAAFLSPTPGLHVQQRIDDQLFSFSTTGSSRHSLFRLPHWLLLGAAAGMTGFLFLIDHRRILPGHCQSCGYNLTGNVSGVCPECGKPAAAKPVEKSG